MRGSCIKAPPLHEPAAEVCALMRLPYPAYGMREE